MKAPGFILFLIILMATACAGHKPTPGAGQINADASLPADFGFSKMGLKVITSTVNKQLGTMSTLYGNDSAKTTAKAGKGICLPGSIFALITWKQQADKRWIGGNIPGNLISVEILKATKNREGQMGDYSRFSGANLKADQDTDGQQARTKYILNLKPSIMF